MTDFSGRTDEFNSPNDLDRHRGGLVYLAFLDPISFVVLHGSCHDLHAGHFDRKKIKHAIL